MNKKIDEDLIIWCIYLEITCENSSLSKEDKKIVLLAIKTIKRSLTCFNCVGNI